MATLEFKKTLSIKQVPKISNREGDDPRDHMKKIGGSLRGQDVLRGLDAKEEEILLPALTGVGVTSQNYDASTKLYWNNISAKIGYTGLDLEIGCRFKDQGKADKFNSDGQPFEKILDPKYDARPINIGQWILWRYCLVYNKVANTKDDMYNSPKIDFYLEDKGLEQKAEYASIKVKNEARAKFIELFDKHDKLRDIYILMSREDSELPSYYSAMPDMIIDLEIDKVIDKKPNLFIKNSKDANLLSKAFIEKCIIEGTLRRIDNTEIIMDGETTIGHTMEEAVLHINDAKNKETKARLEARLKVAKT